MIAVLITIVVLISLFLFLVFPSLRRHPARQRMAGRYIAHRGLHTADVPENSLAAFRAAIERGYAIEIDIHLTADGELAVFHDDDLNRVCGVNKRVEECTMAELKELRLRDTDERIPTLAECLKIVAGQVPLLIEFKCISMDCTALCRAADTVLSSYDGEYWIQSFYPTVLRWYRKHRPDVCRGQLASAFPKEALHKRLLGCLLFNVLARPDFVSYDHKYVGHPCRRLCTLLGVFPVGWTFTEQLALDECKKQFSTYIFEGFIPDKDR